MALVQGVGKKAATLASEGCGDSLFGQFRVSRVNGGDTENWYEKHRFLSVIVKRRGG